MHIYVEKDIYKVSESGSKKILAVEGKLGIMKFNNRK